MAVLELNGSSRWQVQIGTGAKILVVEDDEEFASIVGRHLEAEGFEVTTVFDGESALDVLSRTRVDAIVLDVMLPRLDGIEVCQRLRGERRHTPILMATALVGLDERMAGFAAGADDFLVKPFSLAELVARIRAVLRRDQGPDPSYLMCGDLRADVMTRRAWRGQVELELSPREFSVLELFLRHPGVVLTRKTILGAVWGQGTLATENVVDQYVAHLRRKVDRVFGRADFETLHRVGWRLRTPTED